MEEDPLRSKRIADQEVGVEGGALLAGCVAKYIGRRPRRSTEFCSSHNIIKVRIVVNLKRLCSEE